LRKRKSLTKSFRAEADARICQHLKALLAGRLDRVIVGYFSDGSEPDLTSVYRFWMDSGGRCCFPRARSIADGTVSYELAWVDDLASLVSGRWGIREPSALAVVADRIEYSSAIWFVPGVAFDDHGRRLGRGKGVYDRLFEGVSGLKIGVFYQCQKTGSVPVSEHDRSLDLTVTENGIAGSLSKNRKEIASDG
jgi:5-formyltetrahydrofolate cyclo-ligase